MNEGGSNTSVGGVPRNRIARLIAGLPADSLGFVLQPLDGSRPALTRREGHLLRYQSSVRWMMAIASGIIATIFSRFSAVSGSATAQPRDEDGPAAAAFWSTATPGQKAAVQSARQAYLSSAWEIGRTLKKEAASIRDAMQASVEPTAKAVMLARDAYGFAVASGADASAAKATFDAARSNLRAATDAARQAAKTAVDKAREAARTALDQARQAYVTAVTAAFPAGTALPRGVANPPGGRGWADRGMGGMGGMGGMRARV